MTDSVPAGVRATVLGRDQHACVVCGRRVDNSHVRYSLQHRRARGMGGSKAFDVNSPANLVTVCGSGTELCHGDIEGNPGWAGLVGLRIKQGKDPATEPVWLHGIGKALLSHDGLITILEAA